MRRWLLIGLTLLVVGQGVLLALLLTRQHWQRRAHDTPVVRGRAIAERLGCFGCHGPGGVDGIPNPGASTGEVPSWTGGTWMMWNDEPADVRGWILDGHPPDREPDPDALIPMPAYRGQLTERELDDLVAYVLAVSQFGWPEDEDVTGGRDVAIRFGCFGCHGPEGRGVVTNPLSFKGYIPAWTGSDYEELVRSEEEFRQWVVNGVSDRFAANPAARAILERQTVEMPAYGERISDAELDQLYAYVEWVRAHPRTAPAVGGGEARGAG